MAKPDYRHAYRLFLTFGALLILALVVRQLLQPSSFGAFGPYRGDAVKEAMQRAPRHLGKDSCQACHRKQHALHAKDAHWRVQCEDCHGPAWKHVEFHQKNGNKGNGEKLKTSNVPKTARLARRKEGKELCLICHQELAARRGSFPQVDWKEHYKFVGVKKDSIGCLTCHSPHEPLFMDRDLRKARLHPLIHRCRDCHLDDKRDKSWKRPAEHPKFFECSYCHQPIVKSFANSPHKKKVRCTTCHIFFKESDFAGRIIRDTDPRFCLLCHREGDYRSDDAPPSISWPEHRDDMGDGPEDAKKICIDCHRDNIHPVKTTATPAKDTASEGKESDKAKEPSGETKKTSSEG